MIKNKKDVDSSRFQTGNYIQLVFVFLGFAAVSMNPQWYDDLNEQAPKAFLKFSRESIPDHDTSDGVTGFGVLQNIWRAQFFLLVCVLGYWFLYINSVCVKWGDELTNLDNLINVNQRVPKKTKGKKTKTEKEMEFVLDSLVDPSEPDSIITWYKMRRYFFENPQTTINI